MLVLCPNTLDHFFLSNITPQSNTPICPHCTHIPPHIPALLSQIVGILLPTLFRTLATNNSYQNAMKYLIVTGGVVSGLGKGISISSLGVLLQSRGIKVTSIKIDPYLVCSPSSSHFRRTVMRVR